MRNIANIADQVMPKALHEERTWKANGNTHDIVEAILAADEYNSAQTKDLAAHLTGNSTMESLRNVWFFVKHNIRYVRDTPGHERVKLPGKTWADRTGDCKSMSVFIAGLLKNMGIPCKYRFVSYRPGPVTHVYVVAMPAKGSKVILDAVASKFNHEEPYHSKKDYMTRISMVHGIPSDSGQRKSRPVPTPQYIPFSAITEGEARLLLLKRQLQIGTAVNPTHTEQYRTATNLINDVLQARLHNGGRAWLAGIGNHPSYLSNVLKSIQQAVSLSQPAMRGTGRDHIGFVDDYSKPWHVRLEEAKKLQKECRYWNTELLNTGLGNPLKKQQISKKIKDLGCSDVNKFLEKLEFERIINEKWEKSGYGVLYHFINTYEANKFATVASKRTEHNKAISGLAAITGISKDHLQLMAVNGVKANGIQQLPDTTYLEFRDTSIQRIEEGVGLLDPGSWAVLIGAIAGAIIAATDMLKVFRPEDKVKFALPQQWDDALAPGQDDFAGGQNNTGGNYLSAGSSKGLGLAALAAGAFFILK